MIDVQLTIPVMLAFSIYGLVTLLLLRALERLPLLYN